MNFEPKRGWQYQRKYPLYRHHYHWQCAVDFMICLFMACTVFAVCFVAGCDKEAHADEIPEARAVNAIIGEAESEGYRGMLAIACALRNRGSLQGVYGEKAPRVVQKKYSLKTRQIALQAWRDSAKEDITDGASFWGGKAVDQAWIAKMRKNGFKKTFEYRNQEFYKEP